MFNIMRTGVDGSTLPFTSVVPATATSSPISAAPVTGEAYVYFKDDDGKNKFEPGDNIKILAAALVTAFPSLFGPGAIQPAVVNLYWIASNGATLPAAFIDFPNFNQKIYFEEGVYIAAPPATGDFVTGAWLAVYNISADVSNSAMVAMSPYLATWQAAIILDVAHTRPLLTTNNPIVPPSGLTYSTNPAIYNNGDPIAPNTPTVTGLVTSYTVEGAALPAGLAIDNGTGIITGTPTLDQVATDYTIRATNSAGYTECTLNITVVTPP